jgi:hypothetical protein
MALTFASNLQLKAIVWIEVIEQILVETGMSAFDLVKHPLRTLELEESIGNHPRLNKTDPPMELGLGPGACFLCDPVAHPFQVFQLQ